jgi:hypothetical protein
MSNTFNELQKRDILVIIIIILKKYIRKKLNQFL